MSGKGYEVNEHNLPVGKSTHTLPDVGHSEEDFWEDFGRIVQISANHRVLYVLVYKLEFTDTKSTKSIEIVY